MTEFEIWEQAWCRKAARLLSEAEAVPFPPFGDLHGAQRIFSMWERMDSHLRRAAGEHVLLTPVAAQLRQRARELFNNGSRSGMYVDFPWVQGPFPTCALINIHRKAKGELSSGSEACHAGSVTTSRAPSCVEVPGCPTFTEAAMLTATARWAFKPETWKEDPCS